jgi:RNA polymerase sigma factor (sigma-70 family)
VRRTQSFDRPFGLEATSPSELDVDTDTPMAMTSSPIAPQNVDPSVITHYLHDVRQYPLLTYERERALGQQIQEGSTAWYEALQQSLLHIPFLLACRSRLRRQTLDIAAIYQAEQGPSHVDFLAMLDRLQGVRRCMRRILQDRRYSHDQKCAEVRARRAEMHDLVHTLLWQPTFLQQAWSRFDTAMAAARPERQRRQAARFASTLGYGMDELRSLWQSLHHLHTQVEMAKQEMITRNLRLVISVAREFSYSGLPLTDLIQEGNIGLMRAVEKFDYQRNLKFSTYAIWWIKQTMRRAAFEQAAMIRVPEYMYESIRRVHKALPTLTTTLGRQPTASEMAQHLELPVERVERGMSLVGEPISLDQPMTRNGEKSLNEVIADTRAETNIETLMQQDLQHYTQRALDSLRPREAEVIRRRFGLHGKPSETLRQIGNDLHLSHERVRQIEAEALTKLKQQSANLQDFIDI